MALTIKEILKITHHIDKRQIPCDVIDILEMKYWSHSKNEYIKFGDMDLTHLLRIMNNWADIPSSLTWIRDNVKELEQ